MTVNKQQSFSKNLDDIIEWMVDDHVEFFDSESKGTWERDKAAGIKKIRAAVQALCNEVIDSVMYDSNAPLSELERLTAIQRKRLAALEIEG